MKQLNLTVSPKQASDDFFIRPIVAGKLGCNIEDITAINIRRRSIDARHGKVKINLAVDVYINEEPTQPEGNKYVYPEVGTKKSVVVIGAGPAGLFAALRLIELGLKPIIFERGKDVSARKRDIAAIHRNEAVNPDSNYGFGEGGAGTFSDGKLYTRSKKKGDVRRILEIFHQHGAQDNILIDVHPHIGTNILPRVIKTMRETIQRAGGEIHFNSRITNIAIQNKKVKGVELLDGRSFEAEEIILATGHSARDIYEILQRNGVSLEAKSFAMGVRVEHPQQLIDSIQYSRPSRGKYLPAAAYSFVEQVKGRGVYSFCMCPGGVVVPAATAENEHVVNGMSPSGRNTDFANSGIVVEIRPEDLQQFSHYREFAGLQFQAKLERLSYKMANQSQYAPAQRLEDFVAGRLSQNLPKSSFKPGLIESPMHEWLPASIGKRLQQGFVQMGRRAKGFFTNEAIILGVESRTSSPLRIPRNSETLEHVSIEGLYPCGEGAGYAGGIVSSAIDGEKCAEQVFNKLRND
ncbi:FAD-binding protein [Puteibacter caeruleilacunae]|nr:FAD-binding protein [Puteibacter caeruleilacunae]